MTQKPNIIVDRTFQFAVDIARLYKKLKQEKEFQIGNQLFRSAGSIGANVQEAQAAQSRKDFVSKMSIASKEARETSYWLKVIREAGLIETNLDALIKEIDEIINILTKIIKTSTEKLNTQ